MAYFSADRIKELNGSAFLHPMAHPAEMLQNRPIVLASAEGTTLVDVNGHQSIDMVGGLWCVNMGYSCEPVKQAMIDQLNTLPFFNSFRGTSNNRAIELAEHLREFFKPEGLTTPFYTNSGSESVDTAMRLARQYQRVRGEHNKTKFISLSNSYHGTNFGGASLGGMARFHQSYEPGVPGCHTIPAPSLYRNPFGESDHERLGELVIQVLKSQIGILGANNVCAVVMEPVIGSGGVYPPPAGFMAAVRKVCDDNDILLIADEVITAFGRAGDWTGSRLWGVKPDMMTIAKGLTNGFFPLGAVMLSAAIVEAFTADRSGQATISTGYTYSGHPVGAATAIASLAEAQRLDLPRLARERGAQLGEGLRQLMERHSIIGDVRGIGLMHAIELVSDREAKTPLDKKACGEIYRNIYEAGTMVRLSGNSLFLSPALIIEADQIALALEHIDSTLP